VGYSLFVRPTPFCYTTIETVDGTRSGCTVSKPSHNAGGSCRYDAETLIEGILVDLIGIEPMTSSMPWNFRYMDLLMAKDLYAGRAGKTG